MCSPRLIEFCSQAVRLNCMFTEVDIDSLYCLFTQFFSKGLHFCFLLIFDDAAIQDWGLLFQNIIPIKIISVNDFLKRIIQVFNLLTPNIGLTSSNVQHLNHVCAYYKKIIKYSLANHIQPHFRMNLHSFVNFLNRESLTAISLNCILFISV